MTAKPESVESVVDVLREMVDGGYDLKEYAPRIAAAHRAELAEALKEPTQTEYDAAMDVRYEEDRARRIIASRRRKHGVDK